MVLRKSPLSIRCSVAGIALALSLTASAAAWADDKVSIAIQTYGCQVAQALDVLAGAPESVGEPYLMVAVTDKFDRQISCSLVDGRAQLLCKTGFISKEKAGSEPFYEISKRGVHELTKLGFALNETAGNYQRRMTVLEAADTKAISDLMLTALFGAYGLRNPKAGLSFFADEQSSDAFGNFASCRGNYTYKIWGSLALQ